MSKLLKYAADCTRISAEHGFWEDKAKRNKGEMVALMVSELSEAVEGHRKGRIGLIAKTPGLIESMVAWQQDPDVPDFKKDLAEKLKKPMEELFQKCVKDSVEDEMADTVIRVLDYIYGWDFEVHHTEYRKESMGNFAHDILRIQWYIILAFHDNVPGKNWGYVLAAIEAFCEWYKIDIEQHVTWKMRYNSSRPFKHGKKY